jgi:hypothetical protein
VKLRRTLRRGLCAGLLGSVMLVAAAPAANAADFWNVPSSDFGNQNVGSTSEATTFALQATCNAPIAPPFNNNCASPAGGVHNFGAITTTGPGFAIVPDTDVCNARGGVLITGTFPSVDVCTIQVTFKPTSGGVVTGTLSTTTGPTGPLSVALKGTGIATGKGGQGTTTPGQTGKKCKKKGKKSSATAAKKKCKKKGKR